MTLRAGALTGLMNQPTAQVIDGSVRFDGNNQYLTRSFGSGNRKKWTWACWAKRYKHGASNYGLFSYYPGSGNGGFLRFSDDDGGDTFRFYDTGNSLSIVSKEKFRDTGWYHIVIAVDTSQATDSDRVKRYVNGVRQLVNASNTWPSLNDDLDINQSGNHFIGRVQASAYGHVSLSNNYFIDGQQLGPGYFGFIDPLTNTWRPRKFRAVGTTINDGTVWSGLASVSSGSFQGSYPATNGFNGTLTSSDRANGDTNGSSIDLDFSGKNIIVKNDIAIWSGKSSMRYSINGGEYVSYSDATEKWKTILFSGRLLSLKIKHGSDSEQPGFSGLAVDGVTMLDSTTTNLDFGTNGFYLPMENADDFEIDKSGKGNNWTKNNFSGTSIDPDVLKDSPSGAVSGGRGQTGITTTSSAPGNYCTYNPFDKRASTALSNANLTVTGHNADWYLARCTQFLSTGKYYWEFKWYGGAVTESSGYQMGLKTPESTLSAAASQAGSFAFQYTTIYETDGTINSVVVSPGSISAGDTVMFAYDADAGLMWFGVNGTWNDNADPATGTNSDWTSLPTTGLAPFAGTYNTTIKIDANFGQKPFKYAPPQGFLPVNSASARPSTVIARPDQYVGIMTYTGTSDSTATVTSENIKFTPDFVWCKYRDGTEGHALYDSVRGGENILRSNTNEENVTNANNLKTFIPGGFTTGNNGHVYYDGYDFVSWMWKAGGNKNTFNVDDVGYASAAAAGLTAGTLTISGASVGTKQGFSIIKYAGSGSDSTFPHGLTQAPNFYMIKCLDVGAESWRVYHSSTTADYALTLNTNAAKSDSNIYFNDTEPTSTVASVYAGYDGVNNTGRNYIAYLWHDVPGLQKFGEWTNNNSNDGTFIELGFKPAVLLLKNSDNSEQWYIIDGTRYPNNLGPGSSTLVALQPSSTRTEATTVAQASNAGVDFLSNGFKIRSTNTGSGEISYGTRNYIYAAWAEAPTVNLYGGQSNAR